MDGFDLKLLAALQQDGRLTNNELAERIGLSPSQCSRRRTALEQSGVIEGYHAALANEAVGLGVVVFVQVSLAAQQRLDLRLQVLQLTRRTDLPAVQPGPVPVDPGTHLIHVMLGAGLLPAKITQLGVGHDDAVPELRSAGVHLRELGDFRKAPAAVVQPGQLGVQVRQFEQAQLRFGRCFHGPYVSPTGDHCRRVRGAAGRPPAP